MPDMKYFIPNKTFDNAIKNEEKGVLRALLIRIIGSDPTFSTTEYDEASAYVTAQSKKMNGRVLDLLEAYRAQEDEYAKSPESWDEEYYRMLLVWYRDNYAAERLDNIKRVGKAVYKNKSTLGKAKLYNRSMAQERKGPDISGKKQMPQSDPADIAAGSDVRRPGVKKRKGIRKWLGGIWNWLRKNWKIVAVVAGLAAMIVLFICLLSKRDEQNTV